MQISKSKKRIISSIFIFCALTIPLAALAAYDWWDKKYGDKTISEHLQLSNQDLEITTIQVIVWILGLLGLIAVIFVIYGGFTWLTSAGSEEKIKKAKNVLSAAIIGLIIVILSWAILNYTVKIISQVTSAA